MLFFQVFVLLTISNEQFSTDAPWQSTLLSILRLVIKWVLGVTTNHMTEYHPLIGVQYPVHRGQQLNSQFTKPFPPHGSGLACETTSLGIQN